MPLVASDLHSHLLQAHRELKVNPQNQLTNQEHYAWSVISYVYAGIDIGMQRFGVGLSRLAG
jgi:hypothetical protein